MVGRIPMAKPAFDVNFGARFREGKEARTKSYTGLFLEDPPQEVSEYSFKVRECNVMIHHETLNLVENGRMG
jgi:hypothetical protein